MTFADIPAGVAVFVDANTFVYHFVPDPIFGPNCRQLLERMARQEIQGFTSTHVLRNPGEITSRFAKNYCIRPGGPEDCSPG